LNEFKLTALTTSNGKLFHVRQTLLNKAKLTRVKSSTLPLETEDIWVTYWWRNVCIVIEVSIGVSISVSAVEQCLNVNHINCIVRPIEIMKKKLYVIRRVGHTLHVGSGVRTPLSNWPDSASTPINIALVL